MKYPDTISAAIECLKHFPGIGEKTAERMAFSILELDDAIVETLSQSLTDMKKKITKCKLCNNICEKDICDICRDKSRDSILCVVEDVKNVFLFESIGSYHGKYFVLNHLISPIDGINPEDVNISQLIQYVKKEKITEVILALKPCIEGETTSLYLTKMLEGLPVTVSKIAQGIPIGAEMSYIDIMTLETALEDRKKIS